MNGRQHCLQVPPQLPGHSLLGARIWPRRCRWKRSGKPGMRPRGGRLLMICRSRAHMAPKAKSHGWVTTEAGYLLFLRGAVSPHALR